MPLKILSGLAVTLKCLLEDEDGVVRERSANVLGIIARKMDVHDKGSYHNFSPLNFRTFTWKASFSRPRYDYCTLQTGKDNVLSIIMIAMRIITMIG